MKIQYLYELQYKRKSDLRVMFGNSYDKVITSLGEREILKLKGDSLALEYVGLIVLQDRIISVLPKFLQEKDKSLDKIKTTKLILQVLKKYSSENKEVFNTLEAAEENGLNKLSLIDFLFKDYMEYGLYENMKDYLELNGDGEINWEETIEELDPIVKGGIPYYVDYITNETESNEEHYIRRLHQSVLLRAEEYLSSFELGDILDDIFEIPNLDFGDLKDGLGDEEYQVKMIDKHLKEEYNERKIRLLHRMKDFIEDSNLDSDDSIELFGVNKFWSVWEKVCQFVFKNQYTQKNELGSLIELQTTSKWKNKGDKGYMIPDIVSIEEERLYIFDAKYYTLKGDSFPGVQDVAKQFIYEEVFRRSYSEKEFCNAFLCPGIGNSLVDSISMNYFKDRFIDVIKVDYSTLFHKYINDSHKNIGGYYKGLISKK